MKLMDLKGIDEDYLTTSQAAGICGVTRFTVANWVKEGKLEAIQTAGGHRRIPRKTLGEFVIKYCIPRVDNPSENTVSNLMKIVKTSLFSTGRLAGRLRGQPCKTCHSILKK